MQPDQPVKRESASGVAVSVTELPSSKLAAQVAPQLIPAGLELTWPSPVPAFAMVSSSRGAMSYHWPADASHQSAEKNPPVAS